MWHVVYHRKPIDSAIKESLRFQSRVYWLSFLVYLLWKFGYTITRYEIRDIKFYKSTDDNIILLEEYRGGSK